MMTPEQPGPSLPTFDKDKDVMLFFKYYDPAMKKVSASYPYNKVKVSLHVCM